MKMNLGFIEQDERPFLYGYAALVYSSFAASLSKSPTFVSKTCQRTAKSVQAPEAGFSSAIMCSPKKKVFRAYRTSVFPHTMSRAIGICLFPPRNITKIENAGSRTH